MTGQSAAPKRILVVEDEPDFAALLRSILEKAGYAVTTAYNGDDAMERVCEERPDLITLDIQMPRKSGLLFYRMLKGDETFRAIPVVVVTGLTQGDKDMDVIIRTLLEPENVPHPEAYLEKPVDEAQLLAAVEKSLLSGVSQAPSP